MRKEISSIMNVDIFLQNQVITEMGECDFVLVVFEDIEHEYAVL